MNPPRRVLRYLGLLCDKKARFFPLNVNILWPHIFFWFLIITSALFPQNTQFRFSLLFSSSDLINSRHKIRYQSHEPQIAPRYALAKTIVFLSSFSSFCLVLWLSASGLKQTKRREEKQITGRNKNMPLNKCCRIAASFEKWQNHGPLFAILASKIMLFLVFATYSDLMQSDNMF